MIDFTTTAGERFWAMNKLKSVYKDEPKALQRIGKAMGILQSNYTEQKLMNDYGTTPDWCFCKDWEFRMAKNRAYTGICKHMFACVMLEMIWGHRKEDDKTVRLEVRYVTERIPVQSEKEQENVRV